MDALIKRLETEEPTRELADAALLACGWTVDHEDHEGVIWRAPNGDLIAGDHNPLTSLDAALTLVPEGYGAQIYHDTAYQGFSAASVFPTHEGKGHPNAGNVGMDKRHPAVALTIASLKARADGGQQ